MKCFGKTDVRYWSDRLFRRKRGGGADLHWTAQIQHLGRREQFPFGTPNRAAASTKAGDIYVSLHGRGWEETLAQYKPKPTEPKPEKSTVGDLIREVAAAGNYRATTFAVYCSALRRIAADISKIVGDKSRFAPNGAGHRKWREQVDATPLSVFTADAIQAWKLACLKKHKASPTREHRAINTVNAHLRNARSLFSTKALAFCGRSACIAGTAPLRRGEVGNSPGNDAILEPY